MDHNGFEDDIGLWLGYNFMRTNKENYNRLYPLFRSSFRRFNVSDGLMFATMIDNKEMIDFFISKEPRSQVGALYAVAYVGNKKLVEFFVERARHYAGSAMTHAAMRNNREIIDYLIDNFPDRMDYNCALIEAVHYHHLDLIDFFISKGGNDFKWALKIAKKYHHHDLMEFFEDKIT